MDDVNPSPETGPDLVAVLSAVERTLTNATFKLGRLRSRNRGSALARDLTSIFYDVSAARHDLNLLLEHLGDEPESGPPPA